jgi:putative tricarboxylic transport membrane protein
MKRLPRHLLVPGSCLLFAVYFAIESFGYDLGTWRMPGPGFFPFGAAVLFGMISLYVIVKALRPAPSEENPAPAAGDSALPDRIRVWIIVQIMAGMVAYTLLLNSLGFVLCTFLLALFFIRVVAEQRWIHSLVISLTIAIGFQIVFNVFLNAQIPNGILTFLRR